MSITEEERRAIVSYRLERSEEALEEVKKLVQAGMYNICANRLYYASFYATSALLINHGISASTHTGVRAMLQLHFVRTGLLSKEEAGVLNKNFAFRQQCDYDDFIDASKEDIEEMIPQTEVLIRKIRQLIAL